MEEEEVREVDVWQKCKGMKIIKDDGIKGSEMLKIWKKKRKGGEMTRKNEKVWKRKKLSSEIYWKKNGEKNKWRV